MEEEKIDFVVKIKREQGKQKQKSVKQRVASVSDQSKKCLKQCVVAFIAFCVTFFFF